jgi:hypothetical protein
MQKLRVAAKYGEFWRFSLQQDSKVRSMSMEKRFLLTLVD